MSRVPRVSGAELIKLLERAGYVRVRTIGSHVRLRPRRNADAQDIFVAGKTARVTSVHEDVEGNRHVAVVVEDDPAADLHDWYGRYLYFSPDEIEPLETR